VDDYRIWLDRLRDPEFLPRWAEQDELRRTAFDVHRHSAAS
jgi:hypothetical protein